MRKIKIFFLALLYATIPLLILIPIIRFIILINRTHEMPSGLRIYIWIFCLISIIGLFYMPLIISDTVDADYKLLAYKISVISVLAGDILGILLIWKCLSNKTKKHDYLPVKFSHNIKHIILYSIILILIIVISQIKIKVSSEFISRIMNSNVHPLLKILMSFQSQREYFFLILTFFSVGVITPVIEEFIFRGILLEKSTIEKRKPISRVWYYIVISFLFALLHLPVAFIFPMFVSLILIFIKRKTENLLIPIIIHGFWNTAISLLLINLTLNL